MGIRPDLTPPFAVRIWSARSEGLKHPDYLAATAEEREQLAIPVFIISGRPRTDGLTDEPFYCGPASVGRTVGRMNLSLFVCLCVCDATHGETMSRMRSRDRSLAERLSGSSEREANRTRKNGGGGGFMDLKD